MPYRTLFIFVNCILFSFSIQAQQRVGFISGNIYTAEKPDKMRLVYQPVPFANNPLEVQSPIAENGLFVLRFALTEKASLELIHGNRSIFLPLNPGDSLNIQITENEQKEVNYNITGRGASEARISFELYKNFDRLKSILLAEALKDTNEKAFKALIDNWMDEYQKTLKSILKKEKANSEISNYFEAMAEVKKQTFLLYYASYQRSSSRPSFSWNKDDIKAWKPNALQLMEVSNPEYQTYLTLHLSMTIPPFKGNPCTALHQYLNRADSAYQGKNRTFLQARVLNEALDNDCYKSIKERLNDFLSKNENPNYTEFLTSKAATKTELGAGDPAPDFQFVDASGNTHSLAELKGKVVYLDFWATWCGPCIRAMASAKPLKEKYKNNSKLAFVYVSTDSDVNKWKNHAITNSGDANHWHVGTQGGAISNAYKVYSIPRYVLIDKQGIIRNANAPRPDDPALELELQNLLAE